MVDAFDLKHELSRRVRLLRQAVAGLTLGMVSAFLVFLVSMVTWVFDMGAGAGYLTLWAVFLPGYEISLAGSLVGALWALFWGFVAGVLIYSLSAAGWRDSRVAPARHGSIQWAPPFIRLDPNAIAVGAAAVAGLALFTTTAYLVLRGTADSSPHAALLSWFLPGYSVSIPGAVMGAVEVAIGSYLILYLAACVYNAVAGFRGGKSEAG
jgi:hypothetical protein